MENSDKTAYPIVGIAFSDSYKGLTKREYFAGLAMQGLMVQAIAGSHNANSATLNEERAKFSVDMADAILKQLEK